MAFLLPFIPWLLAPLFVTTVVLALHQIFSRVSGQTLAILGESQSGKTTLSRLISEGILGKVYEQTIVDTMYKGSQVVLEDGTVLHIGDLKDLPGDASAWLPWRNRVRDSHHVVYLLRSHLLRSGRGTARDRCRRDLQQVAVWLREMQGEGMNVPNVVLVFSHRDRDTDQTTSAGEYASVLIAVAGLEQAVNKLKRETKVTFVAGSLASEEAAQDLLKDIGEAL